MPKRYSECEQRLIIKLINYFQLEKAAGKPLLHVDSVYNRVCDALEVSPSTVYKLAKNGVQRDNEFKESVNTNRMLSLGPPLHQIHEHIIRSRIYAMYAAGENVTLRLLQSKLQCIDTIKISFGSLRDALVKMKFSWKKCTVSNRKYLMEMPYVAHKRLQFLRELADNEASTFSLKPVVLDETWIFSKGAFRKSWQDDSLNTVRKKSGEGVRYIILHAGNTAGFIENASLIFKSGSKTGDYHDSMNSENFEKWFEEQLLPNLEEPSLIIMDNAPYHSGLVEKIPNPSWSKKMLMEWLSQRNISFPPLAMKDYVWTLTKPHLPLKKYRVDQLALKHGHRVLRLPPYHCQYNPIEMVWSEAKRYYDSKITSFETVTSDTVLTTWQEALEQITPEKWKNYFKCTNNIIKTAWEQEKQIDASDILPIVLNIHETDSDSSDEELSMDH